MLDKLMAYLCGQIQMIDKSTTYDSTLQALKTLQNLSIVASSGGLETRFKPVIEVITFQILPRQTD